MSDSFDETQSKHREIEARIAAAKAANHPPSPRDILPPHWVATPIIPLTLAPVDAHGLPDEVAMRNRERRLMFNAGRRMSHIHEEFVLRSMLSQGLANAAAIKHELYPLHYDTDGEMIYNLDCSGPCCIDPPHASDETRRIPPVTA